MLFVFHWIVKSLFIVAPVFAGSTMVARGLRRKPTRAQDNMVTFCIGAMIGVIFTVLYAESLRSRASLGQFLLSVYFATALLLVLKGLDRSLRWMLRGATRGAGLSLGGKVSLFLMLVRGVLLIAVGLPLVMAAVMVYRPKVTARGNPLASLKAPVTAVEFRATDGVRICGWWLPASEPPSRDLRARSADFGAKTVIVCPGIGSSLGSQLTLTRRLVRAGYNALLFDFRAHGSSGGQITSLGDLERRDVLGAVRWLRENHPDSSRRIVGFGASTGAAALLAAATDPGPEGQTIQAIVVFGTYDDLPTLTRDVARELFLPPMDWLTARLSVPFASVLTGTDLASFKPARLVADLWPRPILVIHATHDQVVPFEHGRRLFDAASFPKQPLWIPMNDQDGALDDPHTADTVREFFDSATPLYVI